MKMRIMLDEGAYMPERAHPDDAGLDLRTPVNMWIGPKDSCLVYTGVHVEIPKGYYGKLESKSGLNVKHSIVSCGGVIDSGYTGGIVVKLYNMGNEAYTFMRGDKIVQLLIIPCASPELEVADRLDDTERGDNGFGSTGR